MELSAPAQRVLGSLLEKALATPQGYPLSLAALLTACNQATNRDPVTDHGEATLRQAIDELKAAELVRTVYQARSSVPKYVHRAAEELDLKPDGQALLAVLLLRGPQTVGELRARSERLHEFPDLPAVDAAVQALVTHPYRPLAAEQPRRPGQKEVRYRHLLGGDEPAPALAPALDQADEGDLRADVAALREEVAALRAEVARLGDRGPGGGQTAADGGGSSSG